MAQSAVLVFKKNIRCKQKRGEEFDKCKISDNSAYNTKKLECPNWIYIFSYASQKIILS